MPGVPAIVFDRALPRTVARGSTTLRTALDGAASLREAVSALEAALGTPDGRDAAVLLFLPSSPAACRFLNSLRHARATERDRRLVATATRALVAALLGGPNPVGRRQVRLADDARRRLVTSRAFWQAAVQVGWESCSDARGHIVAALESVAATRGHAWSVAQRRELGRRAVSPKTHPVDLANLLTAWECDVPVRHVRLAVRHPATDVAHA